MFGGGFIDEIVVTAKPFLPSTPFFNYFLTPNYQLILQYGSPHNPSGFGSSPINLPENQREELLKQFDATEDGTLERHKSAANFLSYFDFSVKDVNKNGIPDVTYDHPDGNTYLLDANLSSINRSMIDIIGEIAEVADAFPNLTREITGGIEDAPKRGADTRHKQGDAMDISVDGLSAREREEFAKAIWSKLDRTLYDVEIKENHIHVEYHPDSEKGLDG